MSLLRPEKPLVSEAFGALGVLAVVGVVSLLAGELVAFVTFFTGQQALSAQHLNVTLAHPGHCAASSPPGSTWP